MSFVQRKIDLSFRLGLGSFGDSGFNTVTASGLRVSSTISKAGAVGMHTASIRAYGLKTDIANQISTLGKILTAGRNNTVTLSAGDDQSGMSVAFIGTIDEAWSDYTNAPDASVVISAHTGLLDALRPIAPSSYPSGADVANVISSLAQQMGYAFENNGVNVILSCPYFSGTGRQQAYAAARAANVNIAFDDAPNATPTIAIWPQDGSRGGAAPLISPDTGMMGYPTWVQNGVVVKTLFNPNLLSGGQVQIKSSIPNANGTWQIYNLEHTLESEKPDGRWDSVVSCSVLGHQAVAQ